MKHDYELEAQKTREREAEVARISRELQDVSRAKERLADEFVEKEKESLERGITKDATEE